MTGGFPASHRLKIKAQFDWVFSRPNDRCSHGVLQAIYKPATAQFASPGPRIGLIIAKRFLPRAVDRNRLKRLIREGFRSQYAQLPDVDIIIRLMRRPTRQVSAGEVEVLFGKMQRSQTPAHH